MWKTWTSPWMFHSNTMQAIIAHKSTGRIARLTEDIDSNPTATWVEDWRGNKWSWSRMTTEPFAEVLSEFSSKGWILMAEGRGE